MRWLTVLVLFCIGAANAEIPPPRIPDVSFSVRDFGAVGDGKADDTDAINHAIEACKDAGGGRVVFPQGQYLAKPFTLISNLELHLEKGATILAYNDIDGYPLLRDRYADFITAKNVHDIAITGEGTIDGQGAPWWEKYKKIEPDAKPVNNVAFPHRPFLIVIDHCTRLLVKDVTLQNSPSFHLVPQACTDVRIEHINVFAPPRSPNTDAIDPSGWNYLITNCTLDIGDDNVALKAAHGENGRLSCEDFVISDLTCKHGHGISIGSETTGGVRNLIVRNCTFEDTDNGIRLKSARDRGGLVENVTFQDITMKHVKIAINFTSYYPKPPADPATDPAQSIEKTTPIWRNIRITNLKAEDGEYAGWIRGLPEMPFRDVVLQNVHVRARRPMQIWHATGIQFIDSTIAAGEGAPITLIDAEVSRIDPANGQPTK